MKTVTLGLASSDAIRSRFRAAMRGQEQGSHISFASVDLLWKVMTGKRWELLQALTGAGPVTIRDAARRVGRDVKAVHGDVHALLDAGILERTADGKIEFPFDGVHVDFTLTASPEAAE